MKITSISRKLLTRVLSVYFILTISVTGIQIIAEYFNTKSHITSELLTLQKTISGSLTRAVWELNTQQAVDISEGLIAIPMIKGITVTDEANNVITQLGEVLSAPSQASQETSSEHQSISSIAEGLFGHSFPLIFEFSGRTTTVGTVTLLSSNDVIFSRIEVGIYFLIGNAILKTTFLVFLFLLAFTKLLTEPLQELTDQMKQLDRVSAEEITLKESYRTKYHVAANLELFRAQMVEAEDTFANQLRSLPNSHEIPGLLDDITFVGTTSGLDFVRLEWQPEISKEIYIELPIDIEVVGPYHSFGQFVSKIAGLPRIVTVHDFKISIPQGDSDSLSLKLQAKTYRYQEETAK